MKNLSICEILNELTVVKSWRRKVYNLISQIGVQKYTVTIGGSYALKYFCSQFSERDPHDYDLIIRASKDDMERIKEFFSELHAVVGGVRALSSYGDGYCIGSIYGKPLEVLFSPEEFDDHMLLPEALKEECWESPEQILKVKKAWTESYIQHHKEPRQKDLDDIEKIEQYLDPLPF